MLQSLEKNSLKSSDYELLILTDSDITPHYKPNWMKVSQIKLKHIPIELNSIIETSSGEIVIKMHSDITIETEGWLQKIVEFFDIAPQNIGIIGPKEFV